ncbi:MAG: 4'-phosphopantetheinyl transferase superfamily protein [Saprospiraceae bacterium]|jgi:4'-phosphopantetheinyl transferase EntD|nr:4'-phosphopantetheinyl transferase superfamily protein [Saprospiraceae bacterium]
MDYKNIIDNKLYISCSDFVNIKSFFTSDKQELSLDKLCLPQNHNYSPKRLTDFSNGRYCAMKALERFGIQDAVIPIGEEREPIWPDGIVGSISHCDSLTGAIVAKKSDHISLGLDIEEIGRVTPDLWELVFTENEKNFLFSLSKEDQRVKSTAIFSIKEAFYKFQHPLTKTFLDFLDVEVVLPGLNQVEVILETIEPLSIIRRNQVMHRIENDCIISLIVAV